MEEKLFIPYPPDEVFSHRSLQQNIIAGGGNVTHILDHIEYPKTGGIRIYIKDALYPKKGFPFPEAIHAINLAKRAFIEGIKVLSLPGLRGMFLAVFLPFKSKIRLLNKILESYTRLTMDVVQPYFLKPHLLTPVAQEISKFTGVFLKELGIDEWVTYCTARVLETIFEYDDAYRFRLQDILSETTKVALAIDPHGEIKRLSKLLAEREHTENVRLKIQKFTTVLLLVLRLRKIRQAFSRAIMQSDFPNLQFDPADRYWCSMRADYDFFGTKFEDRDVKLLLGYKLNA